jgi:hypothetical protein
MTIAEKLQLLEALWEDLSREPENVPPPPWHEDVLRARELRLKDGSSKLVDWNEAKDRLREPLK